MAGSKVVQRRLTIEKFQNQSGKKNSGFWKGLDAVLRHPVTLLVIGFALTAVVGNKLQTWQQDRDKERIQVVAAQDAIQKIQQAVAEYAIRGRILWLRRNGSPDEQEESRLHMDEALVDATRTLDSQIPVILFVFPTGMNYTPKAVRDLKNWPVVLFDSIERIPTLFTQSPNIVGPVPFLEPKTRTIDPVSMDMLIVQQCVNYVLGPFSLALRAEPSKRQEIYKGGHDLATKLFRLKPPASGGIYCPIWSTDD